LQHTECFLLSHSFQLAATVFRLSWICFNMELFNLGSNYQPS
jgi:hypothetical protein